MAKILEITKQHDLGLYDSATGKDCHPEKVVDITDNCPKINKKEAGCILIFTRAVRGRIVQIRNDGMWIHFFVDELDLEMHAAPRDDTFGSQAAMLGLNKSTLRKLIEENAPA